MFGFGAKKGDPRVATVLEALDIKYRVDDDGDFAVTFELDDSRSQKGFIRSETYDFAGFEIREVFSIGLLPKSPFNLAVTTELLQRNQRLKIGAWSIMSRGANEPHLAIFTAKVAANPDPKGLLGALLAVLKTADDAERDFTGTDKF